MSAAATRLVILLGILLVLGGVNYSIYGKERIIDTGEVIYLELAPVDPRSLMQGDYMALRFRLAEAIEAARASKTLDDRRRMAPLNVDARGVAALGAKQSAAPLHISFRIRNGEVWLGTNAYFFEEGAADRFAQARYGEFRVDRTSGDAVLVGLRDEGLRRL
jgi:uncharacterized membrane-anchored protein